MEAFRCKQEDQAMLENSSRRATSIARVPIT
jgi:hypothetical protein